MDGTDVDGSKEILQELLAGQSSGFDAQPWGKVISAYHGGEGRQNLPFVLFGLKWALQASW